MDGVKALGHLRMALNLIEYPKLTHERYLLGVWWGVR